MSTRFAAGLLLLVLSVTLAFGDAGSTDSEFARATEAFRHSRYADAESILQKLASENPQKALYWFNLANVLYLERKYAPAVSAYGKVANLKSPLADAALLGKAKALRQQGELGEAWNVIAELRQKTQLGTGLRVELASEIETLSAATRRKAVAFYKAEDYTDALADLTLLEHGNSTQRSEFLRGMCLYYLGEGAAAGQVFARLSHSATDPDIRSGSAQMAQTLSADEYPLRPTGILELSGGYNSNFFGSGRSLPVIAGPAMGGALTFLLPWDSDLNHRIESDLVLQDSEIAGFPSDRFLTAIFLQRFIWSGSALAAEISPEAQAYSIGTTPFMVKAGGRLIFTHEWRGDSLSLLGNGYRNFAPSALYSYMEGHSALASLLYGHQFQSLRIEANVSYAMERNQDYQLGALLLPLAYNGPSIGLGAKYMASKDWSGLVQYTYYFKNYSTREQPDDIQRTDHLLELDLRLDRKVSQDVGLFVASYVLLNRSSMGDGAVENETFNAYRAVLGVSWNFL